MRSIAIVNTSTADARIGQSWMVLADIWHLPVCQVTWETPVQELPGLIVVNGIDESADKAVKQWLAAGTTVVVQFTQEMTFSKGYLNELGLCSIQRLRGRAQRFFVSKSIPANMVPSTFIVENHDSGTFVGVVDVADGHGWEALIHSRLGRPLVVRHGKLYVFAFAGWQLGTNTVKCFGGLAAFAATQTFGWIVQPEALTAMRMDDWPYTSELQLTSRKGGSDIRRAAQLDQLLRTLKQVKGRLTMMVTSHIVVGKDRIFPVEQLRPTSVAKIRQLADSGLVEIGSHGAYHLNLQQYCDTGRVNAREFQGASAAMATADLELNVKWIENHLGRTPQVFVAPVWDYGTGLYKTYSRWFRALVRDNYVLRDGIERSIFTKTDDGVIQLSETLEYNPKCGLNMYDRALWHDFVASGLPAIFVVHTLHGRGYAKQRLTWFVNQEKHVVLLIALVLILGVIPLFWSMWELIPVSLVVGLLMLLSRYGSDLTVLAGQAGSLLGRGIDLIRVSEGRMVTLSELTDYWLGYRRVVVHTDGSMENSGAVQVRILRADGSVLRTQQTLFWPSVEERHD